MENKFLAAQFQITQPHAGGENVHLPAGVVDVILAVHVEAGGAQQIGDRRAVRRAAPVADMQRPGRIGRHELDLHALAGADRRRP